MEIAFPELPYRMGLMFGLEFSGPGIAAVSYYPIEVASPPLALRLSIRLIGPKLLGQDHIHCCKPAGVLVDRCPKCGSYYCDYATHAAEVIWTRVFWGGTFWGRCPFCFANHPMRQEYRRYFSLPWFERASLATVKWLES